MRHLRVLAFLLAALITLTTLSVSAEIFVFSDTDDLDIAYIKDSALVTNFNYPNGNGIIARYTGVDLGEAPKEVKCSARFNGGGAVALVTTPSEDWSVAGITARSLHVVFSSEGYYLGFYEDGILTDVLTGAYTLDLTGETVYTFGMTISGSTITLALPNGKTVKKRDDRVKTCNGAYVIFEHYLTAENVEEHNAPAITSVYAKGASLDALKDDFDRNDGLPFVAPSGHVYMQFRNATPEG